MDTLPFVTLRMLKPTVGIMSSLNDPVCTRSAARQPQGVAAFSTGGHAVRARVDARARAAVARVNCSPRGGRPRAEARRTAMTFTSDVLPAAFSPISDSSISSLKNKLRTDTPRAVRVK